MDKPNPGNMLLCPKCAGVMHTYERNGVHLEQCDSCRGIFLDFGELEALSQLENRFVEAAPPPQYQPPQQQRPQQQYPQQGYPQQGYPQQGPGWSSHGNYRYRKGGFGRLFFSS